LSLVPKAPMGGPGWAASGLSPDCGMIRVKARIGHVLHLASGGGLANAGPAPRRV